MVTTDPGAPRSAGVIGNTRVLLMIGTKKGAFLAESDAERTEWQLRGPLISGTWSIYHMSYDAAAGAIYAGGSSNWYGPAVWKSLDLGETWTHSSEGLTYGGDEPGVAQVWNVTPAHGALYAGVDPAGLFRSDDGGATWTHVVALRRHPSRPSWRATNAGLSLHSIVPHPADPSQMWVAISAAGTFHTADGGATWSRCADDVEGSRRSPVAHQTNGDSAAHAPERVHPCVHTLAASPAAPGQLYQQNHVGVFRSDRGGDGWVDVSAGLPSRFGFPLAVHPRRPHTVYAVPLDGADEGRRYVAGGRIGVWRSANFGQGWTQLTSGLPESQAYSSVLRGALALDACEPAGVYFGTTTGQLYGSADEGDSWRAFFARLPPIFSVSCAVIRD